MPKNIEDIVDPQKKTIRDVPMPEGRFKSARFMDSVAVPKIKPVHRNLAVTEEGHFSKKNIKWAALAVGVIVVVFAALSVFAGATLSYTPKHASISFNRDAYTAYKSAGAGQLLFSVVKLSGEKGLEVNATASVQVSRKASGQIIVYNNSGTKSQRLVTNTRFQTPEGKVYRIQSNIDVPGTKVVGGKVTPGSLEVAAYADQPGELYNIDLTDFTLPGLKGDPRFPTIYARSKTAMTGGFVGTEKKVNDTDLATAKTKLEASLKDDMLAKTKAQVPADFILLSGLTVVNYDVLPQTNPTASSVTVNERANFSGIMFRRTELSNYLASKKLSLANTEQADVNDLDSLAFAFVGNAPTDLLKLDQVGFTVSGTSTAVWRTDENLLKQDLIGSKKSDLNNILKNYPSIDSAEASVRPFWKTSFPIDTTKINLKKLAI